MKQRYKVKCNRCNRARFVCRSMFYFIENGISLGRCQSCSLIGNKHRLGTKHSVTTRRKMSIASIGKKKSEQHRINMSIARKGTKNPKISGSNHYNWKGNT